MAIEKRKYYKKDLPEKRSYSCYYCKARTGTGTVFDAHPARREAISQFGKPAKHGACSDQVKCPRCGNFLPTFPDD